MQMSDSDYEEFNREIDAIATRIRKFGGVSRDLQVLSATQEGQGRFLELLALTVYTDEQKWRKSAKMAKAQMESLATQLETVANYAERLASSPLCRGQFWMATLMQTPYEEPDAKVVAATKHLIRRMRDYAEQQGKGQTIRKHRASPGDCAATSATTESSNSHGSNNNRYPSL
jgi:hypothetical protein